jgi:hypothetical protein
MNTGLARTSGYTSIVAPDWYFTIPGPVNDRDCRRRVATTKQWHTSLNGKHCVTSIAASLILIAYNTIVLKVVP